MPARPPVLMLSLAVALWSGRLYADEPPQQPLPRRPIEWASVEVNPLTMLLRQFGGQVQVGVIDVLSVVGSVAYVSRPHSEHFDDYDDRVEGDLGVRGVKLEIGPRFHVPLGRRGGHAVWLWVGPSFYQQRLASPAYVGGLQLYDRSRWVTTVRDGGTLDAGLHAHLGKGIYASGGAGVGMVVGPGQDVSYSPRLLLAFGWGL